MNPICKDCYRWKKFKEKCRFFYKWKPECYSKVENEEEMLELETVRRGA